MPVQLVLKLRGKLVSLGLEGGDVFGRSAVVRFRAGGDEGNIDSAGGIYDVDVLGR